MRPMLIFGAVLLLLLTTPTLLIAQQNGNNLTGSIKGKVKDSTYNFMLTSATVAVYIDCDSSLIKFALPNNFGEFLVEPLPVDTVLRLIITHTGYKPYIKKIRLNRDEPLMDIGLLYMHQLDEKKTPGMLDEVIVKAVPPVRMNGDTLEFNADAFRMNANATGEDWMRILPGLTIWGDGEITFNGKKIQSLLVDGKPFMGGNTTVATQNLPKEALEKLQIYQQRDEKNPLDSTMFANLKLKDDRKIGYFGKLGGGYGTDNRYSADGMLNAFNKKLQINLVGAGNNINKVANSVDVLMKNNSYKGEGLNMDYQSDFNMRGLNRPIAGGFKFQYDIVADPLYQNSSRLNTDYFINDNQTEVLSNTLSNNFLSADTILSRNTKSRSASSSTDQRLSGGYTLSTKKMNLKLNASLADSYDDNISTSNSRQEKTGMGQIGESIAENGGETRRRDLTAGVDYNHREQYNSSKQRRVPSEFTVGYIINTSASEGSTRNFTSYISTVNPNSSKVFDRLYDQRDEQSTKHIFNASYPGLRRLIFNKRRFGGIELGLSATYTIDNNMYTNKVLDKDTVTGNYVMNGYLTNHRKAQSQNFIPAFGLSKTFYQGLTNRYNKWVSLRADLKNQYFAMQHSATQSVQNFSYNYSRFVPTASVEYYNHQYGSYEARYTLGYTTGVTYPGVNNIAPLVDSSNFWYIPKGNPLIQPQYRKELNFKYSFNTRTPKNPFQLDLSFGIGRTDDNITDSTLYDAEGVRTVYAVNMDGSRFANSGIGLKKSFEFNSKKTTLEGGARYDITQSEVPEYINSILNNSKSLQHNINASISYRYRDVLNLKAEQILGYYNTEQRGFNSSRFKSANQVSRFLAVLQMPKNLAWATNVTYNKSTGSNTQAVYFTIWNTSLTYRFLKGNQGEVKFSALDILRQNKGVINTSRVNTQTFTITNVMQQYYMLSLSYYPRQFGKREQ